MLSQPLSPIITKTRTSFLILATAILLLGCNDSPTNGPDTPASQMNGYIFGTFYQITLVGEFEREHMGRLQEGVMETLAMVDGQMSTYREDSYLNRLNSTEVGAWVPLPDELFYVLEKSQTIAQKTDGAFDVTIGGLVNLWTFGPEARPEERPDEAELQARLDQLGYQYLELDSEGQRARRQRDFFVDLGGVAKGYAVDAVADFLQSEGVENYLVNLGGDMIASGRRTPTRSWQIGVEAPRGGRQEAHHIVPLDDMSLATSGDYRNYFEADGQRFSHTIDPRTGKPVTHNLASVSVFTPSNMEADALATAFMVMGTEDSLDFARRHDVPVLLIERHRDSFRTHISPAFENLIDEKWLKSIREAAH